MGGSVWHCFSYVGAKPSDQHARDLSQAVPPLVSRDWLKKPASLREASYSELTAVGQWLSLKAQVYAPMLRNRSPDEEELMRQKAEMSMERLRAGRDISWGHRLHGHRYLALAVIAEWTTSPVSPPVLVQPVKISTSKD